MDITLHQLKQNNNEIFTEFQMSDDRFVRHITKFQ